MRHTTETLGGAGNVANNLAGLGCRVTLMGVCGIDSTGESLCHILAEQCIDAALEKLERRPTITKTRIMARRQQVLRLDEEPADPLPAEVLDRIMARITQTIADYRSVVLSDYGKGMFADADFMQEVIGLCNAHDVPVLVDPKGSLDQPRRTLALNHPS